VGPRNGSLETTRSERSDAGRVAGSLVPPRADAIERAVMSLFNEKLLREIVAEEVRQVVREEWGRRPGASATCRSQKRVRGQLWAPSTIRVWMAQGRLGRYHAGRELRVLAAELDTLMRTPPEQLGGDRRPTPEEEALGILSDAGGGLSRPSERNRTRVWPERPRAHVGLVPST
jgi:hypothetical protein